MSQEVAKLYNTYPFPPDPLLNEPPPGYNWRWSWVAAYNFCTGRKPQHQDIRILDAGCGTGSSTEYLITLNPEAEVIGIDLSEKALAVAQERCQLSGIAAKDGARFTFKQLRLEEAAQLPGQFELINCVGVLHHLVDPVAGIRALSQKLAPGGIMHIFVYAELGRWEIQLMQRAIALLQGPNKGDYIDGVQVGRKLFASLPENNRIVKREKERWALENQKDACFADMYVHPQETDYNIDTLFALINASGLEFVGFSNPRYWSLERLIGADSELLERAQNLNEHQRYRLIELLDPDISHYEFFLARPPLPKIDWSDDATLANATVEIHPCLEGWPSQHLFNYDYELVYLSEAEYQFLQQCALKSFTVAEIGILSLTQVRSLQNRQLIILTP
ncbi:bifunctional 2-polyprenyl-6-hydroxyphenol methylase/3-demethylubiquinol 3-O-methyltransferase UbiG [Gloeocapsa sp. PCC 73106]|uniref:class I SAM-dependent methyltransferase n=1 Tax=Gloeocapsa sp. PCC 73106 TaxID=102232 RepID=UPI0005578F6E|nr:class I SAM-dependent methyltransferase [Gloeocapsa sp. PCC 73106]